MTTREQPTVNDPWERIAVLERRVGDIAARLEHLIANLEAQVEALDASFVRHQGSNEDDFRRAAADRDRVGNELDHHLTEHWRSR